MTTLLDFCRYAIRMDASRRMAYRTWEAHSTETSWETFCVYWAKARELEAQKKAKR